MKLVDGITGKCIIPFYSCIQTNYSLLLNGIWGVRQEALLKINYFLSTLSYVHNVLNDGSAIATGT